MDLKILAASPDRIFDFHCSDHEPCRILQVRLDGQTLLVEAFPFRRDHDQAVGSRWCRSKQLLLKQRSGLLLRRRPQRPVGASRQEVEQEIDFGGLAIEELYSG